MVKRLPSPPAADILIKLPTGMKLVIPIRPNSSTTPDFDMSMMGMQKSGTAAGAGFTLLLLLSVTVDTEVVDETLTVTVGAASVDGVVDGAVAGCKESTRLMTGTTERAAECVAPLTDDTTTIK